MQKCSHLIMFLILLILCSIILLALFVWNKSITPVAFELRGSHVLVSLSRPVMCNLLTEKHLP